MWSWESVISQKISVKVEWSTQSVDVIRDAMIAIHVVCWREYAERAVSAPETQSCITTSALNRHNVQCWKADTTVMAEGQNLKIIVV
jgi:hypothetical protein